MAVMIESLIGILLFTILIVPLTLKNPFASVGDYPPAIREKCMVLCQEKVQIKHAFFKVGLPCQSFCFFV